MNFAVNPSIFFHHIHSKFGLLSIPSKHPGISYLWLILTKFPQLVIPSLHYPCSLPTPGYPSTMMPFPSRTFRYNVSTIYMTKCDVFAYKILFLILLFFFMSMCLSLLSSLFIHLPYEYLFHTLY